MATTKQLRKVRSGRPDLLGHDQTLREESPRNNAVVQVWHNQTWNDLQTVRTLFPSSDEVDLAILQTGERISKPYTVVRSEEVLTTEQKVWVMGWIGPIQLPHPPPGVPGMSPPVFPEIPMVTIGTISAIDPTHPDAFEIHARNFESDRTAGGPIIYWSRSIETLKSLASSREQD